MMQRYFLIDVAVAALAFYLALRPENKGSWWRQVFLFLGGWNIASAIVHFFKPPTGEAMLHSYRDGLLILAALGGLLFLMRLISAVIVTRKPPRVWRKRTMQRVAGELAEQIRRGEIGLGDAFGAFQAQVGCFYLDAPSSCMDVMAQAAWERRWSPVWKEG